MELTVQLYRVEYSVSVKGQYSSSIQLWAILLNIKDQIQIFSLHHDPICVREQVIFFNRFCPAAPSMALQNQFQRVKDAQAEEGSGVAGYRQKGQLSKINWVSFHQQKHPWVLDPLLRTDVDLAFAKNNTFTSKMRNALRKFFCKRLQYIFFLIAEVKIMK